MSKDVPEVVNAEDEFDSAYALALQEAAQKHMPMAIETLSELATGHKAGRPRKMVETTPSTRRQAANDLIQHGHHRSVGKQADIDRALSHGISITIVNQGGDTVKVIGEIVDTPPTIIDVTAGGEGDDEEL